MLKQVNAPARLGTAPVRVVMIPSASGGMGHISRSATLARALRLLDPAVEVEFVLDADRLRAFNIEVTVWMGYKHRLMPARHRDNRDAVARLGIAPDTQTVVYAPRGFPFGREFGHRVLAGTYGAVEALRRTTHPDLLLTLIAVGDPSDLHGIPGVPATLPPWVRVHGLLSQEEALMHMRAASAIVAEGTSTMHEAAALGTPLVLTPGPFAQTTRLATKLAEHGAARTVLPHDVGVARLTDAFGTVLADPAASAAMAARAQSLVTGGGGVLSAARLVLDLAARQRAHGLARQLDAA